MNQNLIEEIKGVCRAIRKWNYSHETYLSNEEKDFKRMLRLLSSRKWELSEGRGHVLKA